MATKKTAPEPKKIHPYIGRSVTPAGIMPEDKLGRFKMKPEHNIPGDASRRKDWSGNRRVKKMFEGWKTYLQMRGVQENKLCSAHKLAIHSLLTPISKNDGDSYTRYESNDNDDSLRVVQSPLKV